MSTVSIRGRRRNIRRVSAITGPFRDSAGQSAESQSLAQEHIAVWYVRTLGAMNAMLDEVLIQEMRHPTATAGMGLDAVRRGLESALAALQAAPPRIG